MSKPLTRFLMPLCVAVLACTCGKSCESPNLQTEVFRLTLTAHAERENQSASLTPTFTPTPTEILALVTPTATNTPTSEATVTATPTQEQLVQKSVQIFADQDGYISKYSQDQNLSGEPTYWIYHDSATGAAYVTFPLAAIAGVDVYSATINMNIQSNSHASGNLADVYVFNPQKWNPQTFTYTNQPELDPKAPSAQVIVGEYTGSGSLDTWFITELVRYALGNGYNWLGLWISPHGDWGESSQEWYALEADLAASLYIFYFGSP